MKLTNKLILVFTLCVGMTGSLYTVKAYSSGYSDSLVNMIYWSQGGGANTYWTGVTNKVDYDYFKPCVGPAASEYSCGVAAAQSTYKEYGSWINAAVKRVTHGLTTSSGNYGSLQYPVTITVKDSDR